MKKLIFLFLFLINLNSLFSFSGGSGTLGDPYVITNCNEFQNISNNLNGNFILNNSFSCNSISNFDRIGYCVGTCYSGGDDFPFTGTLNGQNFTIYDITILNTTSTHEGWGIFGVTDDDIYDIAFRNIDVNVSNGNKVGSLIGYHRAGDLRNIQLRNVDVQGNISIGGVIGYGYGANPFNLPTFNNVHIYNLNLIGQDQVGGIVGQALMGYNIYESSTQFTISANNQVGGIVGLASNSDFIYITNSYAQGSISANNYVGGLGGQSNSLTLRNSFFYGSISANSFIGGLIGNNLDFGSAPVSNNSFFIGNITTSTPANTGSLFGNNEIDHTNLYWHNTSSNPSNAVGIDLSASTYNSTLAQSYFYNSANFPLSSFDPGIWNFSGTSLPILISESNSFYGLSSSTSSSANSPSSVFPFGNIFISISILLLFLFS